VLPADCVAGREIVISDFAKCEIFSKIQPNFSRNFHPRISQTFACKNLAKFWQNKSNLAKKQNRVEIHEISMAILKDAIISEHRI
jgi:hypothetical protein